MDHILILDDPHSGLARAGFILDDPVFSILCGGAGRAGNS